MKARPYPQVIVTRKGMRALKQGNPWVFEGEVIRTEPSPLDGRALTNGCVVDVYGENGSWQGVGLFSLKSKIRVRIISTNTNDRLDGAFWRRKLSWAWQHRRAILDGRSLAGCELDSTCCRVLFSEADGFAGLIVDRYEDVLVAQVGTVGMEALRPVLYPLLVDVLAEDGIAIAGIYERNDTPARTKEGLDLYKGWYDFAADGAVGSAAEGLLQTDAVAQLKVQGSPTSALTKVRENGLLYELDLENSQKTGFFLDQKYNRRAVRELAHGRRVLDCFCHVGPFGMNAAAGEAEFVRCVDISQSALDLAAGNARLNKLDERMAFTCADVMNYLPALAKDKQFLRAEGGPFDLIVLDPPAFTKSRATVKQAKRGYKEINKLAMQLLPRGGYLATCSCSHFMTRDLLAEAIFEAAREVHVSLRQVEERQQAPDHPILWGAPQSHYLDFFVFQVV